MERRIPEIPGYRILERLGRGASGVVYRAIQQNLGREVALNVFSEGGPFEAPLLRERFLQEARLQARLNHPNLLPLFDAGVAGQALYIAVELQRSGSLAAVEDEARSLPVGRVLQIGSELASGLAAAHEAGIVHRDLKPQNVLVADGGTVKIADFGLAKALTEAQMVQTEAGVVMGTLGYIAPEAFKGQPTGPPADVFALGVILFQLLTGQQPFPVRTPAETYLALLRGFEHDPRELRSDVPAGLWHVLFDCLETDPATRPSAREIASRLGRLLRPAETVSVDASSVRTRTDAARASRRKQRQWGGWVAACLLSVAAAFAVWTVSAPLVARWGPPSGGAVPQTRETGAARGPHPETDDPSPAGRLAMPEPVEVALGSDRAVIALNRPALPGMQLMLARTGRATESARVITPGTAPVRVEGLEPGVTYRARLVLGTSSGKPFELHTSAVVRPGGGTMLDASSRCDRIVLSLSGQRLAAAWRRMRLHGEPVFVIRRSEDFGLSWSQPEVVSSTCEPVMWGSVGWLPSGLQAAWLGLAGARAATHLRMRRTDRPAWGPIVDSDAASSVPILPVASGVESGWFEPAHPFCWVQREGPASGLPVPAAELGASGRDLLLRSVPVLAGHVLFTVGSRVPDGRRSLWWARLASRGPPRGIPLSEFQGPEVASIDAAANEGQLLVACETTRGIELLLSRDEGLSFELTAPSPVLRQRGTSPAVAAHGGRFYLAFVEDLGLPVAGAIRIFSSADGQRWQPCQSLTPSLLSPQELRLAVRDAWAFLLVRDDLRGLLAYRLRLR
ncbi:MAG: serine/threonine protein kinase [Candidatus Riflebacteria bacterium]|nr:serine/threonine protein kinase [Candidatus Riflebacteria bacterium]